MLKIQEASFAVRLHFIFQINLLKTCLTICIKPESSFKHVKAQWNQVHNKGRWIEQKYLRGLSDFAFDLIFDNHIYFQ